MLHDVPGYAAALIFAYKDIMQLFPGLAREFDGNGFHLTLLRARHLRCARKLPPLAEITRFVYHFAAVIGSRLP